MTPGAHSRDQALPSGELLNNIRASVLSQHGPVTSERIATALASSGQLLGASGSLAAVEQLRAELSGFGPLQELVGLPEVTDIFVNGPQDVWVDRGAGAEPMNVLFDSEQSVRALAVRLVATGGRRLDDGSPCVDVRLPGGFRVHAVIAPVSVTGTLLSIRIRRPRVFSLDELVDRGFMPEPVADLLRQALRRRLSFLISGATGSGKTTLLSTLLGLCGPEERLVLIEDAAELNPEHAHVLTLESRHSNAEGAGAVDLAELVRQALRMSPTRLIVGECRGAEVRELLAALNTGHSGGGGTIHANSSADVPARLAALGALAGLSPEGVAIQAASALDIVIHVARVDGKRVLTEIGVLERREAMLTVRPAVLVTAHGTTAGPAWDSLSALLNPAGDPLGQASVGA